MPSKQRWWRRFLLLHCHFFAFCWLLINDPDYDTFDPDCTTLRCDARCAMRDAWRRQSELFGEEARLL
jgi:hypothetical protein